MMGENERALQQHAGREERCCRAADSLPQCAVYAGKEVRKEEGQEESDALRANVPPRNGRASEVGRSLLQAGSPRLRRASQDTGEAAAEAVAVPRQRGHGAQLQPGGRGERSAAAAGEAGGWGQGRACGAAAAGSGWRARSDPWLLLLSGSRRESPWGCVPVPGHIQSGGWGCNKCPSAQSHPSARLRVRVRGQARCGAMRLALCVCVCVWIAQAGLEAKQSTRSELFPASHPPSRHPLRAPPLLAAHPNRTPSVPPRPSPPPARRSPVLLLPCFCTRRSPRWFSPHHRLYRSPPADTLHVSPCSQGGGHRGGEHSMHRHREREREVETRHRRRSSRKMQPSTSPDPHTRTAPAR